ncbi:hypothetical protein OCU04_009254 [Sclerotinia nivalis]|uniref:Uncharacterized protein n=1 Tax=Sclerotinia nivalis TaxID=352851 RepID=A0A9X0AFT9_9HELO|nr:hypothetical protein OCU04_009254 [Sclerotinia nivalis]
MKTWNSEISIPNHWSRLREKIVVFFLGGIKYPKKHIFLSLFLPSGTKKETATLTSSSLSANHSVTTHKLFKKPTTITTTTIMSHGDGLGRTKNNSVILPHQKHQYSLILPDFLHGHGGGLCWLIINK